MNSIQTFSEDNFSLTIFKETPRVTLQSDLNERFDCNYREPEYFRTIKVLEEVSKQHEWVLEKIGCIDGLTVKVGSTPKGKENFGISGVPFIKTKNVYKGYLKTDNFSFLTEKAHRENETNKIKDGDILLTIIGANFDVIGRAYLFNHHDIDELEMNEANINQNIARLSDIPDTYERLF